MSKDKLPTKKDVASDLLEAIRLLKHVENRLGSLVHLPDSKQALIVDLRVKILEYLKGR
jgi:hypothetical protein